MFGMFKKKPAAQPPASDLIFKSNEAAFQYACAYLGTTLDNEQPVLAIVLEAKNGGGYCVKLSNPTDASIPTQSPAVLLESGDISNICFHASAVDSIKSLRKGDLVMYVAPAQFAAIGKGHMSGVLIGKVEPQYSMAHGGWRRAAA
jgi:hypothetical protein